MKTIAYMAQSLDGYIAGPDGELDWLEQIDNPERSDFGFAEFMGTIDALLMGKNTFEKVFSFGDWPYEKPVYVASNSLQSLPSAVEASVAITRGDIPSMLKQLESEGVGRTYIDGGQLIQSALAEKALDELVITTVPVLLGEGIPLFTRLPASIKLELLSSEVLLKQLVKNHYRLAY